MKVTNECGILAMAMSAVAFKNCETNANRPPLLHSTLLYSQYIVKYAVQNRAHYTVQHGLHPHSIIAWFPYHFPLYYYSLQTHACRVEFQWQLFRV